MASPTYTLFTPSLHPSGLPPAPSVILTDMRRRNHTPRTFRTSLLQILVWTKSAVPPVSVFSFVASVPFFLPDVVPSFTFICFYPLVWHPPFTVLPTNFFICTPRQLLTTVFCLYSSTGLLSSRRRVNDRSVPRISLLDFRSVEKARE